MNAEGYYRFLTGAALKECLNVFDVGGYPQIGAWRGRAVRMGGLRAMPRWAWVAVLVGVVLPLVVLGLMLGAVALVCGLAVFIAVRVILAIRHALGAAGRRPLDDGRRNVKIVVHSARVVDP